MKVLLLLVAVAALVGCNGLSFSVAGVAGKVKATQTGPASGKIEAEVEGDALVLSCLIPKAGTVLPCPPSAE